MKNVYFLKIQFPASAFSDKMSWKNPHSSALCLKNAKSHLVSAKFLSDLLPKQKEEQMIATFLSNSF